METHQSDESFIGYKIWEKKSPLCQIKNIKSPKYFVSSIFIQAKNVKTLLLQGSHFHSGLQNTLFKSRTRNKPVGASKYGKLSKNIEDKRTSRLLPLCGLLGGDMKVLLVVSILVTRGQM